MKYQCHWCLFVMKEAEKHLQKNRKNMILICPHCGTQHIFSVVAYIWIEGAE